MDGRVEAIVVDFFRVVMQHRASWHFDVTEHNYFVGITELSKTEHFVRRWMKHQIV